MSCWRETAGSGAVRRRVCGRHPDCQAPALKPTLHILARPADLYSEAAEAFVRIAQQAVAAHGKFSVALAGGSTPKALCSLLAADPVRRNALPLGSMHFFWGDERHVPPDHAESNFRMAQEAMLAKLGVGANQVHRIPAEYPDASHAADEYERTLREFFALRAGEFPRFDLVLLGIGTDGHTASLFPGTRALDERLRIVVSNRVDKLDTDRVTLTVPAINNAAHVVFLVSGADKAPALKAVLEGPRDAHKLPAQLIAPHDGTLTWLVDREAARLLEKQG